ncbi:hypothetical protein BC826DRAFT_170112 [Russula brevipes]|nr:hypothetical protein BC826DRAFT_170112 [Russula brevipes]
MTTDPRFLSFFLFYFFISVLSAIRLFAGGNIRNPNVTLRAPSPHARFPAGRVCAVGPVRSFLFSFSFLLPCCRLPTCLSWWPDLCLTIPGAGNADCAFVICALLGDWPWSRIDLPCTQTYIQRCRVHVASPSSSPYSTPSRFAHKQAGRYVLRVRVWCRSHRMLTPLSPLSSSMRGSRPSAPCTALGDVLEDGVMTNT